MAAQLDADMVELLDKLEESERFYQEALSLEKASSEAAVQVLRANADARERVLEQALKNEQLRSQQAAKETVKEDTGQYLWAAAGLVAGIVVGVAIGSVTTVYVVTEASTP